MKLGWCLVLLLVAPPAARCQPEGVEAPAVPMALDLLEAGRAEDAVKILETAVREEGPRRFAVWSLLARTQLRLGRAQAALESFDEALARAPGFLPARVGRAEAEIALGRLEAAAAGLERLSGLPEPPPRSLELLAGLRLHGNDLEGARALWRRLASLEGDDRTGERWPSELMLLASERAPAARDLLLVEVERDLSAPAAYVALGVERLLANDSAAAAKRFRVAFEIDEHDPIVRLLLERATGAPADPPQPVERLKIRVAEAMADWDAGRLEEAGRAAREILAARPHHAPLALIVARMAERGGDHWAAVAVYEELVSAVGVLPSLAAGAARSALAVGALGQAECRSRTALGLRPGDPGLLRLLAAARAGSGDRETAIELLREATVREPADATSWLRLGDLLFDVTRAEEALDAYRQAVELDPAAADEIPAFALAALVVGQAAGEVDTELLARHAERHPESVDTLYSVGVARLRAGDLATAERVFQELARAAPEHSQVIYNLAQVHQRQGRPEEARALMDRFRSLKAEEEATWERHNRAHFRRLEAEESETEGRLEEALARYDENLADGTATLADALAAARLLQALGRHGESLGRLEQVLEAAPHDRDALELLASVERKLGRTAAVERTESRLAFLDRPCER